MFLYQELKKRVESNSPVKVGLIGAGKFGSMFLSQVPTTSGLEVVAIADLNPKQAKQNCNNIGWDKDRVNSTVFFEDVSSSTLLATHSSPSSFAPKLTLASLSVGQIK